MSIVKIVVADVVYTGVPLGKATSSEEQERQAEALAGLKGSIISAWVSAQYPDAELYADVAIYTGSGRGRSKSLPTTKTARSTRQWPRPCRLR